MKNHEQFTLGPKQKSFIFFIQTDSQKDRETDRCTPSYPCTDGGKFLMSFFDTFHFTTFFMLNILILSVLIVSVKAPIIKICFNILEEKQTQHSF